MGTILPDTQMGPLGSILLWITAAVIVIVALFTTGIGPILVAVLPILLIITVIFVILKRFRYRLTRGGR